MNQKQDITTALETRYLLYAVSTIMDRALPDARDGLKPVHRRILYAMNQLRLYPQSNFRKCSYICNSSVSTSSNSSHDRLGWICFRRRV